MYVLFKQERDSSEDDSGPGQPIEAVTPEVNCKSKILHTERWLVYYKLLEFDRLACQKQQY